MSMNKTCAISSWGSDLSSTDMGTEDVVTLERLNAQPAYAKGFGVAGAHLSRRSENEGGTLNAQHPTSNAQLQINRNRQSKIGNENCQGGELNSRPTPN